MIRCHDCFIEIEGCSGSTSWPTGRPFVDAPIFHRYANPRTKKSLGDEPLPYFVECPECGWVQRAETQQVAMNLSDRHICEVRPKPSQ